MKLSNASFEFRDADVAQLARNAAQSYSLTLGEPDIRASGAAVVDVKGSASDVEQFTRYVTGLGSREITLVSRFYVVPFDAPLAPDDLVAAAANYSLRAFCPDEPDAAGNFQLQIRNQQKWIQDRFAAYLADLGIHHA